MGMEFLYLIGKVMSWHEEFHSIKEEDINVEEKIDIYCPEEGIYL